MHVHLADLDDLWTRKPYPIQVLFGRAARPKRQNLSKRSSADIGVFVGVRTRSSLGSVMETLRCVRPLPTGYVVLVAGTPECFHHNHGHYHDRGVSGGVGWLEIPSATLTLHMLDMGLAGYQRKRGGT